jgi:hypothetical protein
MGNFTIASKFLKLEYVFEGKWTLSPSEYIIKDFSGISFNDINIDIMSNLPMNKHVSLTINPDTINTLQFDSTIIEPGLAFININRRNTRYFYYK